MILNFALGLIFWQLLPEILTKSYQILNDPLNDIWNWSYKIPYSVTSLNWKKKKKEKKNTPILSLEKLD